MNTNPPLLLVIVLAFCAHAPAQQLSAQPRYPIGFSLDPGSPEVAGSATAAADVYVTGSNQTGPVWGPAMAPGGGTPVYTATSLGLDGSGFQSWLPAGGLVSPLNVDAITEALDFVPSTTITSVPAGREFNLEFSIARDVAPQFDAARDPLIWGELTGNGAASDTFTARYVGPAFIGVAHGSDHLGLHDNDPWGPGESDIDALVDARWAVYPVFFSLDDACAEELGVSGADIFVCWHPGTRAEIFIGHWELGLPRQYDIDALSISRDFRAADAQDYATGLVQRQIVFSLTKGSPNNLPHTTPAVDYSAVTQTAALPVQSITSPSPAYDPSGSGAFLYTWNADLPTPLFKYASPEEAGLSLFDDLNGTWGHDPKVAARGTANGLWDGGPLDYANSTGLLPVTAHDVACLTVNGEVGGADRTSEIDFDYGAFIDLQAPSEADGAPTQYLLFARAGDIAELTPISTPLGEAMLLPGAPDVLLLAPSSAAGQFGPAYFAGSQSGTPFGAWIDTNDLISLGLLRITIQGIVWFQPSGDPAAPSHFLTNAITLAFNVMAP